jgi:hypothetical protein
MIERNKVYEQITKEDQYAQGWAKGKKSAVEGIPDHMVSRQNGQPFGYMDWITFAEKYLNEAKEAYSNFMPDARTVRIRILKAASLLTSALQCHGEESDLQDIAGVSSSKFPITYGGLQALKDSDKEDQA